MSLIAIQDAHNLRYKFDIEGTVKCLSKRRFVNLKDGSVASVANALLSDDSGHRIKVSFWNDDIKKIKNNLKIRIKNVYTKIFRGDTILYKSKNGSIDILDFNPNQIYSDILCLKKSNKIKSFTDYYNYITKTSSDLYLGIRKLKYLLIVKAFYTIQEARKSNFKRNKNESSAILYLYNKISLPPEQIQQILNLFGTSISWVRILQIVNHSKEAKSQTNIQKIDWKVLKNNENDDTIKLEVFCEELPNEIAIDEFTEILNTEKPLCDSTLDFDRKYRGYHDFYER